MEDWLHLCTAFDWKSSFSWEKIVVHQLDLMTDLLGTLSTEAIHAMTIFAELNGIIWTGTQREGSKILEQHEEEEANSFFPY
jgi:hypothetical protein